jgi:uncharacterized protein YjbJ (UPF0337 family)
LLQTHPSVLAGDLPYWEGRHVSGKSRKVVLIMNWDQVAGQWKQVKGNVKEKFGKLTDDDLTQINGKREQFIGKVQERYGVAKEEAQRRTDEWLAAQHSDAQPVGQGASASGRHDNPSKSHNPR